MRKTQMRDGNKTIGHYGGEKRRKFFNSDFFFVILGCGIVLFLLRRWFGSGLPHTDGMTVHLYFFWFIERSFQSLGYHMFMEEKDFYYFI